MAIHWSAELETGIRHIDLQHQELVDMMNAAEAAFVSGQIDEVLQSMLPALSAYVVFHFGMEEALMAGTGIEAEHALLHRQAHHDFSARVDTFKQQLGEGHANALPELLTFLQEWLVQHIMKTDKELGRQVRTANLARASKRH